MSVLHVTSWLILFVSMATLLVNGGPAKRHLNKHSPNRGRPRSEGPLCRQVCSNITLYCQRNCYPPSGNQMYTTTFPGGATTAGFVDPNKIHCLSKCIDDDEPIVFKEETCSMHPQTLQPQDEEVTPMPEEGEIDVSTLTMTDRCHMEAWVNSTVCQFDRENPVISKKVFDVNKPKLTLCTGSPVVSGRNGFSLKKSFSQEQKQSTATLSRKERSIFDEMEGPAGSLRESIRESRDIKDIRQSWHDADEFCPTLLNYESPRSAVHLNTNLVIDLYFYAGYSQWFQLGTCDGKNPKKNIPENVKSHCDVASTAVKAWVMIDPKTFAKPEKVKNCGTVKEVPYLVCNDWVLLPTHCKHFFQG